MRISPGRYPPPSMTIMIPSSQKDSSLSTSIIEIIKLSVSILKRIYPPSTILFSKQILNSMFLEKCQFTQENKQAWIYYIPSTIFKGAPKVCRRNSKDNKESNKIPYLNYQESIISLLMILISILISWRKTTYRKRIEKKVGEEANMLRFSSITQRKLKISITHKPI